MNSTVINSGRKNRYDYIDYAKAVAIFLIGIGHFLPSGSFIRVALYSFHVPVFFFIAGYLYRFDPTTNFFNWLTNKVGRILLPYFLFFALSLSVVFLQDGIQGIVDAISENLFFVRGNMIWNTALWFLPVYFLCVVVFQLFNMAAKNSVLAVAILGVVCIASTAIIDTLNLHSFQILGLNKCICMLAFVCLGRIVRHHKLIDAVTGRRSSRSGTICMRAAFFVLLFCAGAINTGDKISILDNDYNNIFLFLPFAMALSFTFVAMFITLKASRLIRLISANTIFFLGTHLFFRFVYSSFFQMDTIAYVLFGVIVFVVYVMFFMFYDQLCKKHKMIANLGKYIGLFSLSNEHDTIARTAAM